MKIYKIILITLLFLQYSCGYKIVNNSDNFNFKILQYELTGENKVNNFLKRNFMKFQSDENYSAMFDLVSNSKIIKSETSKNSSGDVLTYEMKIIIRLEVYENGNLVNEISFDEKTDYNNADSKFELKQYESVLIQDLTNQIIIRINNYLSSIK